MVQIKQWERKKCKPNSLPILQKMHVKVGDTVKVISGREKGKIGEITKVFRHNSTVIVKDLNLKTKHMKSKEEGQPGQIIKVSFRYMHTRFSFDFFYLVHCTNLFFFFFPLSFLIICL